MTCCPWPQHCTCVSPWSPAETLVVDVPHTHVPVVLAAPELAAVDDGSGLLDLGRSGDSWELLLRELRQEGLS
jgi:hypothetical protein